MNKLAKYILANILVIVLLLGILELFLFITIGFPVVHKVMPGIITKISRRLYFNYDMNSIQYVPECARFDPQLGYTLKPGNCVFSDIEFTTQYTINSLGVRDTEEALNSPQVVVLGDSYAMGWGVQQNETFAKIIETKTGLAVLNASVASFGTAREMMLLKKVKRDRLKYLIIQYCNNDYKENVIFLTNGNKLITMNQEKYEQLVKLNQAETKYYLGKYLFCAAKVIKNNFDYLFKVGDYKKIRENLYKLPKNAIKAFLNVVQNSGVDLTGVQLLVFCADETDPRHVRFVPSLKEEISSGRYPPFIKNMIILDVSKYLTEKKDIFLMNGHYNQRGNRIVAEMLMQQMARH
jgi:hypothetical protein